MSYNIYRTNGNLLTTIPDGVANTTSTPLTLPGRSYPGYGLVVDTNFVHQLENFANITPPANPIQGQLWYNTNNNTLYICPQDGITASNQWFPLLNEDANGNISVANINVTNNAVISGNLSVANVVTANYIVGNGNGIANITGANVTGQVPNALVSGTVYTGAQPNITSVGTLSNLAVTGNTTTGNVTMSSGGNVTGANVISANYFSGDGSNLTNIAGNAVTGTVANALYATAAGSIGGTVPGSNVIGPVANATYADLSNIAYFAGNVTASNQPNITSVGVLTSLRVSGISNLSAVGNVQITGGSPGQVLQTDGNGNLSWYSINSAGLVNGTSNGGIPVTNGNINFSVGGSANILVVTSTGVNVSGTLNATGNANVGNIGAGNATITNALTAASAGIASNVTAGNVYANSGTVGASLLTGTLTTAAQPNITSVGTLSSLAVSGTTTSGLNGTTGYTGLFPGDTSHTGYLSFYFANGTRDGYIGYGTSSALNLWTDGSTALQFGTNNNSRMIVDPNGNIGIGNSSPTSKLSVNGNGYFGSDLSVIGSVYASNPNPGGQFNANYGSTNFMLRNDGNSGYILKNGTASSGYDSARPFSVNLSTNVVSMDFPARGGAGTQFGGTVYLYPPVQSGYTALINMYGGSSNPNKFLRIDPNGNLQIVNNAYSNVIFNLADNGDTTLGGNITANGALELTGSVNAIRMRNGSAGDVTFYDIRDPDLGVYNYTMRMDNGAFAWAFSTTNSPYDYGNVKMSLDLNGNLTAASFSGDGSRLTGSAPSLSVGYATTAGSAANATNGVPVGSVFWVAMNSAPTGYLPCDGRALSTTSYAALFAAIGYTHGGGGGTFNLPNLYGTFIRGIDNGRGVDPGRAFGSTQTDAFQGHRHSPLSASTFWGDGAGQGRPTGSGGNYTATTTGNPVTDGTNGTPRTASETRPINVALLPIIKY